MLNPLLGMVEPAGGGRSTHPVSVTSMVFATSPQRSDMDATPREVGAGNPLELAIFESGELVPISSSALGVVISHSLRGSGQVAFHALEYEGFAILNVSPSPGPFIGLTVPDFVHACRLIRTRSGA